MFNPCYPVVRLIDTVVARPVRRVARHVVGHGPVRPRTSSTVAPAPKPQPSIECVAKPGPLPAGPGAAVPIARATKPAAAGLAASVGGGSGALGAVLGGLAGLGGSAGLVLGGAMLTNALVVPTIVPLGDNVPGIANAVSLPENPLLTMRGEPTFGGSPVFPVLPASNLATPLPPTAPFIPQAPNATGPGVPNPAMPDVFGSDTVVSVPEPASLALLALGAFGVAWGRRRKRG